MHAVDELAEIKCVQGKLCIIEKQFLSLGAVCDWFACRCLQSYLQENLGKCS